MNILHMLYQLELLGYYEISPHLFVSRVGLVHEVKGEADLKGLFTFALDYRNDEDSRTRALLFDVGTALAR